MLVDELVVGHAALVHLRALVLHHAASARSFSAACWAMRAFCSATSARCSRSRGGAAVLAGDGLAALRELALGLLALRS